MQRRLTSFVLIAAVFATGAIALVSWDSRQIRPPRSRSPRLPPTAAATHDAPALPVPVINSVPAPSTPSTETVAQWIADIRERRCAQAGRCDHRAWPMHRAADALPVLRRLLTDGEPQVDRRLALNSLRELALDSGRCGRWYS